MPLSSSSAAGFKVISKPWRQVARGLMPMILILFVSNNQADAVVCYRKHHEEKGLCKSTVNKPIDDAKTCCTRYGQGYATEIKAHGQDGKWFECTPCNVEGEHSKWPKYKPSYRSASKHSKQRRKLSSEGSKSNLILSSVSDIDWSPWSEWGPCSATCGEGLHQRTRFCLKDHCMGEDFQQRTCQNLKPCVVDGGWTDWLPWEPCSSTCGNGSQTRVRTCTNPLPQNGGKDCEGANIEEQVCSFAPCPIDGGWSDWSEWGVCNVTCGTGVQERMRDCSKPHPYLGGKNCTGHSIEQRPCGTVCVVDGGWSEWSNWTQCSVTCGDGFKSRSRRCDSPLPLNGGKPCEGLELESAPCTERTHCAVNGNWSEWSKVDGCSARPCSGEPGFKTRFRSCTNPRPMFGGKPCTGRSWKREQCYNNDFCTEKVDGGWCDWKNWTDCRGGIIKRERACGCPPPVNGGAKCYGVEIEEKACFAFDSTNSVKNDIPGKNRPGVGLGCRSSDAEMISSGDGSDVNCDDEDTGDETLKIEKKTKDVGWNAATHFSADDDDDNADDDVDKNEKGSGMTY